MTYYVTAIEYSNLGQYISNVLLHLPAVDDGRLLPGRVVSKNEVIRLIRGNNVVKTAVYNYESGDWREGAIVRPVQNGGSVYLRTDADQTLTDNLGNLLLINEIR